MTIKSIQCTGSKSSAYFTQLFGQKKMPETEVKKTREFVGELMKTFEPHTTRIALQGLFEDARSDCQMASNELKSTSKSPNGRLNKTYQIAIVALADGLKSGAVPPKTTNNAQTFRDALNVMYSPEKVEKVFALMLGNPEGDFAKLIKPAMDKGIISVKDQKLVEQMVFEFKDI